MGIQEEDQKTGGHGPAAPPRKEILLAAALFLALAYLTKPLPLDQYTTTPLIDPAGILQVYPWVHFNDSEIRGGHFPLWNPYSAMGEPHLANIQTAVFFPYFWLWTAVGAGESAYGALLVFRLFLAALFWFVFARRILCSFPGALVAGAAYAFGGYGLWFIQLIDLKSQMLLPLLLLAPPRLIQKPTRRGFVASAFLVALTILGGHPEAAFVTLLVAALYTLTALAVSQKYSSQLRRTHRGASDVSRENSIHRSASDFSRDSFSSLTLIAHKLLLLSAAGLVGLVLSSVALLPFLNYLSRCWTIHGSGFGFFHLDPRGFFNLLLPGVHALFRHMPTEIPVAHINQGVLAMLRLPYSETAVPGNLPGAGLVICGLAAFAFLKSRRLPWPALFFAGLLAVLLGLTFGLPGFRLLALIPPLNLNSNFKFFFSEIHACLAILAGMGLDGMWSYCRNFTKEKFNKIPVILLPFSIAYILLMLVETLTDRSTGLLFSYWQIPAAMHSFIESFFVVFIFFFMGALFFVYGRKYYNLPMFIALLFICLDLRGNSKAITPYVQISWQERMTLESMAPVIRDRLKGGERMTAFDQALPANLPMLEGIKDIRSSDALFYKPYVEFLNRINGLTEAEGINYFYPSYYTRPSSESLLSPDAANLSVALAFSPIRWIPRGITDLALVKGDALYAEAPPSRQVFLVRSANRYSGRAQEAMGPEGKSFAGLFLHAPAMIAFSPTSFPDHQFEKRGDLAFMPAFLAKPETVSSDGVIFQTIVRDGEGSRLAYSLFLTPAQAFGDAPVLIPIRENDGLELSTLAGPRNNRANDWSGFSALAFYPGGYRRPPEPLQPGSTFYQVPHSPWAHGDGKTDGLAIKREAGDLVSIDLNDAPGETLVVHEAWYPGWRVAIDGKAAKIEIPEDKVSWRVKIPEGAKEAVFRFTPDDFALGLFGTLTTALIGLMMLIIKPRMNPNGHR